MLVLSTSNSTSNLFLLRCFMNHVLDRTSFTSCLPTTTTTTSCRHLYAL